MTGALESPYKSAEVNGVVGKRRQAREFAMSVLYQVDICRIDADSAMESMIEQHDIPSQAVPFMEELVRGVLSRLEAIDTVINEYSKNWPIERMPAIDRNILRMAVLELLFMKEIPHNVSINEAIELANTFSTEDSGRFVNGILDSIYREKCSAANGV